MAGFNTRRRRCARETPDRRGSSMYIEEYRTYCCGGVTRASVNRRASVSQTQLYLVAARNLDEK
jgi:hypothetical protein